MTVVDPCRPGPPALCRGVVQLFNAVQKHQKTVDEKVKEAGGSERKRAKLLSTVSKRDFISVLRGMDGSAREPSAEGRGAKARQVRFSCGIRCVPRWALTLKSLGGRGRGSTQWNDRFFRFHSRFTLPQPDAIWILKFRDDLLSMGLPGRGAVALRLELSNP